MKKKFFLILLLTSLSMLSVCVVPVFCTNGEEISLKFVSDRGRDFDGDGLFEYLEIRLEANVSSTGVYILESSNLEDSSGNTINATAYEKLSLSPGEHVLTVLLDGRVIHSSGLNPVNVSFIGLISEDYMTGDFLNNVPLSREYDYTEFESPPEYEIGVEEGDWVRYRVSNFLSPDVMPATGLGNYLNEILVKVEKIEGLKVSLEMNFFYVLGNDQSEVVNGYLERESQIFPFLIPANMGIGDSISQLTNATISSTRIENILGEDREINYFKDLTNFSRASTEIILEQGYHWDKETGILASAWINTSMLDLPTGEKSYNNVSFSVYRTNIISQRTSIKSEAPVEIKLGEAINITVVLRDFHEEGIEGEQIILKLTDNNNEIGEGLTDSDGYIKFNYTPKQPGECRMKAAFMGSEEFLPSESSVSFTVRGSQITQYLPWIAILFLIIVVTLIYYKRERIF